MGSTSASIPQQQQPLLFSARRRPLHQILGGGIAADVILWRRKNATLAILLGALGTWIVFQCSGHTLLSLLSKVALLLTSSLFLWAKAAILLRRQLPPLPDMTISEESMNAVAASIRSHLNAILAVAHDLALGKETHLFVVIVASLWVISFISSFMDFVTLCYTCIALGLTVPVLYEKYECHIERGITFSYMRLRRGFERMEGAYGNKARKWILYKRKVH